MIRKRYILLQGIAYHSHLSVDKSNVKTATWTGNDNARPH